MTFALVVIAFVLSVLLLNERDATGKAAEERNKAVRNYQAAEKWFIAAVTMANNEQEIVNALTQIQREESMKWDRDWHGDKLPGMSVKDKRFVDNAMLGHLLKMHREKKPQG